jgi:hypothetical protein
MSTDPDSTLPLTFETNYYTRAELITAITGFSDFAFEFSVLDFELSGSIPTDYGFARQGAIYSQSVPINQNPLTLFEIATRESYEATLIEGFFVNLDTSSSEIPVPPALALMLSGIGLAFARRHKAGQRTDS